MPEKFANLLQRLQLQYVFTGSGELVDKYGPEQETIDYRQYRRLHPKAEQEEERWDEDWEWEVYRRMWAPY